MQLSPTSSHRTFQLGAALLAVVVTTLLFPSTPLRAQAASGWLDADIGAVAAVGSSSESGGSVTVTGSGEDIAPEMEEFHFRYVEWTGQGIFIARVTSLTPTHEWAKAGLMLRAGLAPGSPFTFACVNPRGVASNVYRSRHGATGVYSALNDWEIAMPMWVKLVRARFFTRVYSSVNGTAWTFLGETSVAETSPVQVGFAVSSHADGTLATATFDQVSFATEDATNLAATVRSPTEVTLTWSDNAQNVSTNRIERSTDGVNYSLLAEAGVGYTDYAILPGTTYHYRVRPVIPEETSGYSNVATVTLPSLSASGWGSGGFERATGRYSGGADTFTIAGSGAGIGGINGTALGERGSVLTTYGVLDQAFYVYKPVAGNQEIIARVSRIEGPETARAGIMVRAGSQSSAFNVFISVAATGYFSIQGRLGDTQDYRFTRETRSLNDPGALRAALPLWLKLVRMDSGIAVFTSLDGASWREERWVRLPMASEIQLGFAVASGDVSVEATATFDHVVVQPAATIFTPPPAPGPLALESAYPTSISLSWYWRGGFAERFEIERAGSDMVFSPLDPTGFSYPGYRDSAVAADTTYNYRVRAVRAGQFSAWSQILTATATNWNTDVVPIPPTGLIASAEGVGGIALRWMDNSANEHRFLIEHSIDGVNFTVLVGALVNAFTHTGLEPGTTRYYRVRSENYTGASMPTNIVQATTNLTPTSEPRITVHPTSTTGTLGSTVELWVGVDSPTAGVHWRWNTGTPSQTGPLLEWLLFEPRSAGFFSAVVTDLGVSTESAPAVVTPSISSRLEGAGTLVATDVHHQNGNIYDQVLPDGHAVSLTAQPGKIVRASYIDLSDDIVQVEFSGAGTLTLSLPQAWAAPAPPVLYNQPEVAYKKGDAYIFIAGADETTNLSVFTVGRITAVNQALFRDNVTYDGMADIAAIGIISTNGKFGGIYAGNAGFGAQEGVTGLFAPGIDFSGPIRIHDIRASGQATPMFVTGATADVDVAAGSMEQPNGRAVQVGGVTRLDFVANVDSHGRPLSAQRNAGRFTRDGEDVTDQIVMQP